jgi:hypothetical protein
MELLIWKRSKPHDINNNNNVYKSVDKRPFGRPRRRRGIILKQIFRQIGCEDVDWNHLAQNRVEWCVLLT